MSIIETQDLCKQYGNVLRVSHLNLNVPEGSVYGFLGPNGAGKSTLMKLLVAGLLPTSGNISVDGTPLHRCEKALKAKLGYLPQSFGLYDELTVWQFLDYMAALKGSETAGQPLTGQWKQPT